MDFTPSRPTRNDDRLARLGRLVRGVDARVIDAVLALALASAGLVVLVGRPEAEGFRNDDLFAVALVLVQTLPLALRRMAPVATFAIINTALVAHSAMGYEIVEAGTFSSLISVYSVASLTDNKHSVIAAAASAVAIAGFYATNRGDWSTVNMAATSATWAMAWLLGVFLRMRGEQAEAAGARAASLELEQESRALEAVADERARMARELHDIIGHALNLIVIQASGAQRVFDTRPDVPREILASIEGTGREALNDMERMLGVLRAADAVGGTSEPQPGLDQLEALAARVSEAGISVDLQVQGQRREVPASVDLSAYRIVQECLTNCLKHSGASHATVAVHYGDDALDIDVVDDGRGAHDGAKGSYTGGRGHLGMRERVALFGGEISFGPLSAGPGYRVHARLPFRSQPA